MRKSFTAMFLALAPVAALTALAPVAPAQAQQAEVSVSLFYDQLSAHGKWVEHPRWGWVWYPTDVDRDWRPYTRGRWVWTQEYGWYWASYEPFGWAVYHYGRWGYDDEYGWVWVPGDRWAASWVAFRYGDRAIGWAPLPPDTLQVSGSVRIDDAVLTADYYQPRWVFVEPRFFADIRLAGHVVPLDRNVTYIRETRNVTNITVQNNVFVNRSFEPQRLRAVIGREVPTVHVRQVNDVNRLDIREHRQTRLDTINVFTPQVRVSRDAKPPERARAKQNDRPKVRVQEQAVKPEDRRAGPNQRTRPGAPPSARPQERGRERERGQQPGQPPHATPGAPPSREGTKPGERPGQTPPRTDENKRGATPAQPPKTSPGAPPSREGTKPGERPGQTPSRTDENKRGATPAQPPKTSPGAPPSRGTHDEKRGATPAQPPKTAPGAPPSRGEQKTQPQKRSAPDKSDDKKETGPNR